MDIDNKMLDFETEKDFKYRIEAIKIIKNISPSFNNIEYEIKEKTFNLQLEKKVIIKEFEKFKNLECTELYSITHEYSKNAFESILKAIDILLTVKVNANNLQKSYKYMDCFVSWTKLASAYIYISLENKSKEAKK